MILDVLAEKAKQRTDFKKKELPLERLKEKAYEIKKQNIENKNRTRHGDFCFEKALMQDEISFICEVKKASPSKGIIAENFAYLEIAQEYEAAGAAAISVLTEPEYFLGCDRYLEEISANAGIPVLRKDFTVDEYQIYEAKLLGADAVLLICAVLAEEQIEKYISICDKLGMSALVEAHTEAEVKTALRAHARIIGVNNRNLGDFTVNPANCLNLREKIPKDIIFVAESGMKTPEDIILLKQKNVNAVLIGETLMKSQDKNRTLKKLRGDSID